MNIAEELRTKIQLIESADVPSRIEIAPLPFEKVELEPVMSKDTIEYHYDSLAKAYAKRYNAGEGDADFNRGGALLHNLFFTQLQPPKRNNRPIGAALLLIHNKYGTFEEFKDEWLRSAMSIQGSGWVYLSKSGDIKTIKNQDYKKEILLPLDMWEHSFALDYRADKKKYINNFWRIVNWDTINLRLNDF